MRTPLEATEVSLPNIASAPPTSQVEPKPQPKVDPTEKDLMLIEAGRKEINRVLSLFLIVAFVVIFLRFVLALFAANPSSPFVMLINLVSGLFLLPFFGIAKEPQTIALPGESYIDGTALIGLFCYLVLVPVAMVIVSIGAKMLKTEKQKSITIHQGVSVDPTKVDKLVK